MPANLERPNRGGKPLVSVGIDGPNGVRASPVLLPPTPCSKLRCDVAH